MGHLLIVFLSFPPCNLPSNSYYIDMSKTQTNKRTETMYLNNNDLQNVARAIQINFSDGSLHSRSRVWEIFPIVVDELADMGYPQSIYTRKSLVLAVCKMAKSMWIGQIQAHQTRRGGNE